MLPTPARLRSSASSLVSILGIVVAAAAAAQEGGTTVIEIPGKGENRIVVTDNAAQAVAPQCSDVRNASGNTAKHSSTCNINTVRIKGQAVTGRTIIVKGRNVNGSSDETICKGCAGSGALSNVNSVIIE